MNWCSNNLLPFANGNCDGRGEARVLHCPHSYFCSTLTSRVQGDVTGWVRDSKCCTEEGRWSRSVRRHLNRYIVGILSGIPTLYTLYSVLPYNFALFPACAVYIVPPPPKFYSMQPMPIYVRRDHLSIDTVSALYSTLHLSVPNTTSSVIPTPHSPHVYTCIWCISGDPVYQTTQQTRYLASTLPFWEEIRGVHAIAYEPPFKRPTSSRQEHTSLQFFPFLPIAVTRGADLISIQKTKAKRNSPPTR